VLGGRQVPHAGAPQATCAQQPRTTQASHASGARSHTYHAGLPCQWCLISCAWPRIGDLSYQGKCSRPHIPVVADLSCQGKGTRGCARAPEAVPGHPRLCKGKGTRGCARARAPEAVPGQGHPRPCECTRGCARVPEAVPGQGHPRPCERSTHIC